MKGKEGPMKTSCDKRRHQISDVYHVHSKKKVVVPLFYPYAYHTHEMDYGKYMHYETEKPRESDICTD